MALQFQPCPAWRRRYPRGVLTDHERIVYLALLWNAGRPVAVNTLVETIYGGAASGVLKL